MNRELQTILRKIERQGWTVVLRKSGHYKIVAPSGQMHFCPATPSDWRATRNLTAALRRMGAAL